MSSDQMFPTILDEPIMFCASDLQKGQAAQIRYEPGVSKADRIALHQIVHSGDRSGPYADTTNPYRDHTNSHDPAAQKVLEAVKAKK